MSTDETTDSTDATDSTDTTDATDSTDSTDTTNSTDSTDATDSTDTTDATDSTDSTDSTDNIETEPNSKCGASKRATSSSGCGASKSTETDGGVTSASSSGSNAGCGASKTGKKEATDERVGSTVDDFDADPGRLVAVGLGPGQPEGMTARARAALLDAEHIVGYTTYIDLLPDEITEAADELYDTPMCGEVSRTEEAIDRALSGHDVAIIGSGDPNVYALSGLALEILESKGGTPGTVDFEVVPGVPAAQSCGARLGAPLVNDTVSISLSDHLTPMADIESRLHAVAGEGFTIAIYNPWSRKRRENFRTCCEILSEYRAPDTPVGIVHGAGREDEQVEITTLGDLEDFGETDLIDMTTTILVGNDETYVWGDRMVTPRGYESKYDY